LGFITLAFYLVAGIAGAPIFTNHTSGISHLTGATGGYLVGMLIAAWVTGALAGRKWDQKIRTVIPTMILGNVISTKQSWRWTLEKGLTPFLLGEFLKIAIASTALPTLWKFVRK
jgi:biotin transport system substrate-specific component